MLSSLNYTQIKIVVLGDSSVGKTNILRRYCFNNFDERSPSTIAIDFVHQEIMLAGKLVKVQFWDTAGQEKYRSIAKNYYKLSQIALVVFDVTNRSSFQNLDSWLSDIKSYGSQGSVVIVLANKIDKIEERQITTEEGREFCLKYSVPYYEVSASMDENGYVHQVIDETIKHQLESNLNDDSLCPNSNKQIGSKKKPIKTGWCC